MPTVSVLGGYGNFGRRICEELIRRGTATVRVVGRESEAGRAIAHRYGAEFRPCDLRDLNGLSEALDGSVIVIDAAGPFQTRDYKVAEACIEAGMHYIDIADAREYVLGISRLDEAAAKRGVMVTSGASSVPAVSAAMVDTLVPSFHRITDVCIAVTSGNKNARGAATLSAGLAGVGRPFRLHMNGQERVVHGWGDRRKLEFPIPVGPRNVYLLDVPDVALFPERYDAATVRFYAGVEMNLFNHLLTAIGWMRRKILDLDLTRWGHFLEWVSGLFTPVGTNNGALAVWVRGTDEEGKPMQRRLAFVTDSDGPATPCAPPLLLAERILAHGPPRVGAFPCVGLLTYEEIAAFLVRRRVWPVFGDAYEWEDRAPRPVGAL